MSERMWAKNISYLLYEQKKKYASRNFDKIILKNKKKIKMM